MKNIKIEYTENLTKEFEDVVYKGFEKHSKENDIEINFKRCAFVVKDDKNEIFGGIIVNAYFKEVYVDELFIKDSLRHQGYGSKLLLKVEELFKEKGYDNINLTTFKFQAPEFYKKCGFELEFIRKNKENPKLDKYFFVKRFK